uniref:WLM domain-containing protein n=1 Tax=viral metagenome TaxID=1070528 RepID=A0A6C0L2Z4_9ZZZZ|tara:strand:+ start:10784 stop:11353 length:570 start_codon:yes stop_codon:yes gene_type:complete
MDSFIVFFLSIFVLFIIISKIFIDHGIVQERSDIDNLIYIVRKGPGSKEAANKLALLNQKAMRLIQSLDDEKEGVPYMKNKYSPNNLSETTKNAEYTSYSVNKGEHISLCIRNNDGTFIDENTIIFVFIHELSHVMTEEIGHPKIFWDNMKYLLEEGEKLGIYEPVDYKEEPKNYCGMEINSTPYEFKK